MLPGPPTGRNRRVHHLQVCDLCHSRKVRCDRNDPCGNCQDMNVPCSRNRRRVGRRQVPSPSSLFLNDTRNSPAQRVLPNQLVHADDQSSISPKETHPLIMPMREPGQLRDAEEDHPQTRMPVSAFDRQIRLSSDTVFSSWGAVERHSDLPAAPSSNGRNIIEHQLQQIRGLTYDRRCVLQSALYLADQITGHHSTIGEPVPTDDRQARSTDGTKNPSIEFLDWMLRDIESDRFGAYVSDFFKHISKPTLRQMGLFLYENKVSDTDNNNNNNAVIYTVCVNAIAHKFLTTIINLDEENELRDQLHQRALEYKAAAQAAVMRIPLLATPSLALLQAILCGIFLYQGSGDTTLCWELTRAACKICRDLGLDSTVLQGGEISQEAYYCFLWCYILDKNFACRLGFSKCQLNVDFGTGQSYHYTRNLSEFLSIYLELAKMQAEILPHLENQYQINEETVSSFRAVSEDVRTKLGHLQQRIDEINESPHSPHWRGLHIHSEMPALRFAYHTVETDVYHLLQMNAGRSITTMEGCCLRSARRELMAMVSMCGSQESLTDMQRTTAFLHWTLLFYPLTAIFVLFCNAVVNSHSADFNLLKAIADCLGPGSRISPPLAKMQSLFRTFVELSQALFDGVAIPRGQQQQQQEESVLLSVNSSLSDVDAPGPSFSYTEIVTGDDNSNAGPVPGFGEIEHLLPWDNNDSTSFLPDVPGMDLFDFTGDY